MRKFKANYIHGGELQVCLFNDETQERIYLVTDETHQSTDTLIEAALNFINGAPYEVWLERMAIYFDELGYQLTIDAYED